MSPALDVMYARSGRRSIAPERLQVSLLIALFYNMFLRWFSGHGRR
jgi:hypothetical protein